MCRRFSAVLGNAGDKSKSSDNCMNSDIIHAWAYWGISTDVCTAEFFLPRCFLLEKIFSVGLFWKAIGVIKKYFRKVVVTIQVLNGLKLIYSCFSVKRSCLSDFEPVFEVSGKGPAEEVGKILASGNRECRSIVYRYICR